MFSSCIESYEIPRTISNDFLTSKISFRSKYEEFRETTETKREVNDFIHISVSIQFFSSHVSMNIDDKKNLINDVIYYPHFVHNIVPRQWIVNKIMVEFAYNKTLIFKKIFL